MAPDRIVCERCGSEFDCSPSKEGECWCAKETFRGPMPLPPEAGGIRACMCPSCLRQSASGSIDVADDHVRLEVFLPWFLAKLVGTTQPLIRKEGPLLLEKKK